MCGLLILPVHLDCKGDQNVRIFNFMADGSLDTLHTKGSLCVAYRTLMNMDKGSRKTKLTWKVVEHFAPEAYTQEVIDDVRERWCRFFIDNCL
ncbi:uncharacterized protein [Spinacia oleracea]|uniref:Uncharacterized protein isoform X2 n=1 Tax=Spinacia oleracea TaxID=3562 RepID=A0A9R0JUP4_SPIOL|nr:uncharacterized protein LOC110786960 isoform X2 [Spinacia oleracea]